MKAIILARISTKEQSDGHSLSAQTRNLELYAQRKGLAIVKTFTLIESSTKGERPEFDIMISFIKAQKTKVALIVDCVDRLQRSFRETPILNALIEKDCLELHFVKENNIIAKDANSAQKMMWNMSVCMAQSYTDQLSDNVKRSILHKIRNGEWSGPAPLGYVNAVDVMTGQKTITPDPERGEHIQRLFIEYSSGAYSLAELVRKAEDWGLRTRKDNPVSAQTLHDIVRNPFYYGTMKVKGTFYPHRYEPLIPKSIYDLCQEVLKDRGRVQAVRETKEPFLFRGLIKCAVSGRTVTCDRKKDRFTYLICRDRNDPDKKIWVNEDVVIDHVRDMFRSIQIPDDVRLEIIDHLKNSHESEKDFHHESVDGLNREMKELDVQLDKLMDLLLDDKIPKDAYNRKFSQINHRQSEISELLENHREGNKQFKIAVSTLLTLASRAYDIFESSKIDEKRAIIQYAFSNRTLDGGKPRFTMAEPFATFAKMGGNGKWLPE